MKKIILNKNLIIRYGCLLASLGFIGIGIFQRNEVQIMFNKAVNICLECIGVG